MAARVGVAALILVVPVYLSLRGRTALLRKNFGVIVGYGLLAVVGAQVCFFYAVQRLSVGVALLLEYLGVVLVVIWMWLRHGQRPRRLTVAGAVLAVAGLALVMDVGGDTRVDLVGVLWGLGAAVGLAGFYVLSSGSDPDLPPVAMAGLGMAVSAVALLSLGAVGVLPMRATFGSVELGGNTMSWVWPVLWLSVVAAAIAYVAGVYAARILGAKLSSFIGLTEVGFAVLFAWLLLGELPAPIQLMGGGLILAGIVLVRLDESPTRESAAATPVAPS